MKKYYIVNPCDVGFIGGSPDNKPLAFDTLELALWWVDIVLGSAVNNTNDFEVIELDEGEATSEKLYSIAEELHAGL